MDDVEWVADLRDGNSLSGQNRVRRQRRLEIQHIALHSQLNDSDWEYESSEVDIENGDDHEPIDMRHVYFDSTWKQESFKYYPSRRAFVDQLGLSLERLRMPIVLCLFCLF